MKQLSASLKLLSAAFFPCVKRGIQGGERAHPTYTSVKNVIGTVKCSTTSTIEKQLAQSLSGRL
jgi:hypothetical protein